MGSITYYEVNNILKKQYNCQDLLKEKLTLDHTIKQEYIHSVFNNDGRKNNINSLFEGNKQIGRNDWDVIYVKNEEFDRFSQIENKVDEMSKKMIEMNEKIDKLNYIIVDELLEQKIRNTASNIILFFLGEQPKQTNGSFRRFKEEHHKNKLNDFIEKNNIIYNTKTLGNKFDDIISNINTCIHPSSFEELREDVEKCQKYITQYPELMKKFEYEIFTINHYLLFKEHSTNC